MKKRCKAIITISVVVVILVVLCLWTVWGNTALKLNKYDIENAKIPEDFDSFKIAHISDLHNKTFGENNSELLDMIKNAEPDIIAITGDIIDSTYTNTDIAVDFLTQAVEIAPCYYVTGNHEARELEIIGELLTTFETLGVDVLDNESVKISKGDDDITLLGINDPSFVTDYLLGDSESVVDESLASIDIDNSDFNILLSHRPELFEVYTSHNIDLTLSGHAHGGQFRLPIIGGIYAPNQGIFPKYDSGMYTKDGCSMIVSRGIGNSLFPLRFNNRPEVILIELKTKA